jgi:tight adherence protein C
LAVLAGTGLGTGLWLVVAGLPVMRRRSFADRIYPQLKSVELPSRLLHPAAGNLTPFGPLERIVRPLLLDAVHWLGRFNPAPTLLSRRLVQAGRSQSPVEFRAEQLLWSVGGLGAGITLALLSVAAGSVDPVFFVVVTLALAVGGFLLRDYLLGLEVRRREAKMLVEFPGLAELMALAVGAGESATGALERICRSAQGELAAEFARVLAATRSGIPLLAALRELSNRTRLPALVRFVDGISVAMERGTPLADVLRAQAQDVRDMAKRSLMESAGRKEIGMMIPLVFGVLPLTVLFAVYPGLALLNLGW